MRTAKEVFEDHLQKRLDGDIEGDIRENYDPHVVLLTGTGIYRGHDGVRKSADELKEYLGDASMKYTNTLVDGDHAFLEWSADSDKARVRDGADSFMVQNGKICVQTIHYTARDN